MKRFFLILLLLFMLFPLSACSPPISDTNPPTPSLSPTDEKLLSFEERRYTYTGEENDICIENDRLIIQSAGTYRLSGNLKEGAIGVRVAPDEGVRLILAGVSIQSSHHAPLNIESAACVTLELERDCVNTFTDTSRTKEKTEDFLPVSCIEVDSDLIIEGEGSLVISGRATCALACSESIVVQSGQITLSAVETGLWVRDRLCFQDGTLTVTSAQYGIAVSEGAFSLGILEILGGRLSMVCTEVALSAGTRIDVSAGEASLRAPVLYRCERTSNNQTEYGIIQIESLNFPAPS